MSKVFRIDPVEHALFAAADHQVRSGNQDGAGSVQVIVILIQLKVVGGRKPVEQVHLRIQFDKALAELRSAVPTAVSSNEVDVALVIHGRRLTGLPDACFLSARRSIEDTNLLQRCFVVAEQESVIGVLVAMRSVTMKTLPPERTSAGRWFCINGSKPGASMVAGLFGRSAPVARSSA